MTTLKSCPFCGGIARFSVIPGHGYSILCHQCGALAVLATSTQQRFLADAWNKRVLRPNFSIKSPISPCPFCATRMELGTVDEKKSIIQCHRCGMMISFVGSTNFSKTATQWNKRP